MSHNDDRRPRLGEILQALDEHLAPVRRLITVQLLTDDTVRPFFSRLNITEGKMLRPALVVLAGQTSGALNEKHTAWAAIVEMVHLASLLHDDVIDNAAQRRGAPTANARWGNTLAVLLGDFVLCRAFDVAQTQQMPAAADLLTRTAQHICLGEIEQNRRIGDWAMTAQDYLDIVEAKTASLFEACCRLGAMASEAPPAWQEALGEFGKQLGVAFQICDDVLDIAGSEATEGKSLGSDLVDQKPTLPILYWLADAPAAARRERLAALSAGEPLWQEIRRSGALERCAQHVRQFVCQAVAALACLPNAKAKDQLAALAYAIADRTVF